MLSGGGTALQSFSPSTGKGTYRMQLNPTGVIGMYKATDDVSNWDVIDEVALKSDLSSMYQRFSVKYSSDLSEYDSEFATNQLRILFGVIENASEPHPAMLSFDIEWIRFQVRIDRDSIKIRKRYGSNAFTEWKTIQP